MTVHSKVRNFPSTLTVTICGYRVTAVSISGSKPRVHQTRWAMMAHVDPNTHNWSGQACILTHLDITVIIHYRVLAIEWVP